MGALFSYLFGQRVEVQGEVYRVIRRIGEGGFSYVNLVQSRAGSRYALKEVLLQEVDQLQAIEREIESYQKVSHPNLIKLVAHEVKKGRSNMKAFLIFPFYREGTLESLIERSSTTNSPLPEKDLLSLFVGVCDGLNALHTHTVPLAHRDVKPGNLLLSDNQKELILMDFGSLYPARVVLQTRQEALSLQELAAQICTANYRAPELFEVPYDAEITEAVDIWSLGCTMFEAAFWRRCCDGSATSAVSGRIPLPSEHQYSEQFVDLLKTMLQVDPKARPSASLVKADILTLISNM